MEERLYEIAVDAPLSATLTYAQPAGMPDPLPAGCCVRVPLGARSVVGYVLGPGQPPDDGAIRIKPIDEVLGGEPPLPLSLLPFFRWIAQYYHHPLGLVLRTALPQHPTSRSSAQAKPRLRAVLEPGPLLAPLVSSSPDEVELWLDGQLIDPPLKKAERKALVLFCQAWCEEPGRPVPRSLVLARYPGAGPRLNALCECGLLVQQEERVFRDPFAETPPPVVPPEQLTDEQEQVLNQVLPAVDRERFAPFLVHGVTGCGKTEVYLRAVERALARNRTALALVPEIALASQLEAQFHARFGDRLAVLHSGLSPGERLDQWQRVRSGAATVVLGARSAVFAPLERLGVVVVDEEHEPAYKQDEGLRYNGRDLAVLRAQQAGCPVLLGSATPSVVSYHHARQHKYTLLTMTQRISGHPLPSVEVVDLSTTQRSRPDLSFSDPLINALATTLEQRQQSLLFINRRGFSPFMLCRDCGTILQCPHCQVSLTLHKGRHLLLCHYCGYARDPAPVCPGCGSLHMSGAGIGSERIEAEVGQLFPEARIARLDSDTMTSRQRYLKILQRVREGRTDILIGTQMVAKGLHFPQLTLVGVVWADIGLGLPDYKASERTFSLLSQVMGRAGRGREPGRVIIQTYQPHQYSIELARRHDYPGLYQREIAMRAPLGYPPFSRLVNLRFSGRDEGRVEEAARAVAAFARQQRAGTVEVLGPAPAPLVRLRDKIRWQLLLKGGNQPALHALCDAILTEKKRLCPAAVDLHIDVDPENIL
ncbi:MAG: replication restart helicase PriA [Desulfobulbus sp.]|jgi:primosomal protein N' (replication factor Y)